MPELSRLAVLAACAMLAACVAAPDLPPVPAYTPATLAATRYKAVLIAGDGSLPVFDNAVDDVANTLRKRGALAEAEVQRLSGAASVIAQDGVRSATLEHVLTAIAAMRPGPGQGCFVFATSHGTPHSGLVLHLTGETLSPESLDAVLAQGCGNAPTAVVVSGCFSGNFAQAPMTRANRIVLTAARADRPSFGCGAGRRYTVYDKCLLATLDTGGPFQRVYDDVVRCVTAEERKGRFKPSEPQAWFGSAVAGLGVP